MSIKSTINLLNEIRNSDIGDLMNSAAAQEKVNNLRKEMEGCSNLAEKVICERLPEADFVKLMFMIQKTVSAMAASNGGSSIVLAEVSGELQSYTQTVILTAIGYLIQEEIL